MYDMINLIAIFYIIDRMGKMTSFWFDLAFLLDPVLIGISVIIIITSSVFYL